MTDRPNAVLVVLDTARAKDTVPIDPEITPTMARLAEEGTEYTRTFSSAPWTLPSHASLFTGTYSSKHGAHGDHTYLDGSLETLAEAFEGAGYETVGVSNNTWITGEFGFDRGFETFRKGWQYRQSEVDHGAVVRAEHPVAKVKAAMETLKKGSPLVGAANIAYSEFVQPRTDDGAERTATWVDGWLSDRHDPQPFFLFVNCIEPHIEYRPPEEFVKRFLPADESYDDALAVRQDPRAYDVGDYSLGDREFELLGALYRGEIAYLDDCLGRLVETLKAAGEWEETILVVTGDHGENIGEHGFLGHQYNLYDTLLHVPLVVRGGAFTDGERRDDLVQLLDLAPTLLDAAGLDRSRTREQYQGRSFHPEIGVGSRESIVAEYIAPQPSMATLEARFGALPDRVYEYDRTLRAIRTDEYKYIRGSDATEELYHVAEDPRETIDRVRSEPGRAAELRERLERWRGSFEHTAASGEVSMSDATKERLSDLGYLQE